MTARRSVRRRKWSTSWERGRTVKKTVTQEHRGKVRIRKAARPHRTYTATEKCQAVLAVWTERRTVSEICREMGITWSHLSQWQDKALAGMVRALETRRKNTEEKPPPLTERLEKLLAKQGRKKAAKKLSSDLEKRLQDLQDPPQSEKD
jgi:transposase-like protein